MQPKRVIINNPLRTGTKKPVNVQIITPLTEGQTEYEILPQSAVPMLEINGQLQEYGSDFTISGSILQWISSHFRLGITDQLNLYFV